MKLRKHSVFYRALVLTLSGIILNILGFAYRIFLGRSIGAEGMGLYQLVLPFYSLLQSVTLSGLTVAVSGLAAEECAKNSLYGAGRVLHRSFRLFLSFFCLAALITLCCSGLISERILGDGRTENALLLLLPCLCLTGFENLYKNYFYGIGVSQPPITSELTEQIVRFLAVALLLLLIRPHDPGLSCTCIVLGMVISEIASVILLTRFYRKRVVPHAPTHTTRAKILEIALPVMLSGASNNLLSSVNAVLIPQRLMAFGLSASQALSEYGILFGMTMPLLSLPFALLGPLTLVLVPKLAEGMSTQNTSDVKRKVGKALHTAGLLAFPAIALLLPLANALSELLYQQKTTEAYLLPLCLITFFGFYQLVSTAVLNGIGKQRRAAIHILIGGIVQLFFTWAVGYMGMIGFIIGDLLTTLLIALLNLHCIFRTLKMRVSWRNWVVTPFLSALLSYLMVHVTFLRLLSDRVPAVFAVILAAALGTSLYLCALYVQGTSLPRYLKKLTPQQSAFPPARSPLQKR